MVLTKTVVCGLCDGTGKVTEIKPGAHRTIRKKAGLGLREAARIGKIDFGNLSKVERGKRKSTPEIDRFYGGLVKSD